MPDFADTELWVVRSTLKERYGHDIELEFAQTGTVLPEGNGTNAYDEIGDAAIAVLQVEADHIRKQKITINQTPAKDDKPAPDKPDLSPFFWGD